jgi:hypothetical protein
MMVVSILPTDVNKSFSEHAIRSLSDGPVDEGISDMAKGCEKCSKYIRSICCNMNTTESDWFKQCIKEIGHCDGHLLLERFLRIFRAFNPDYTMGAEL